MRTIDSIQKLLVYVNPGIYGGFVLSTIQYSAKAKQTDTIKLDLDGYVIVIYKKAFKEPYPKFPTPIQKERINTIWDALGHPEKKLQ